MKQKGSTTGTAKRETQARTRKARIVDPQLRKKTAIERGKRVQFARQLAQLTRKEMLEKYGINDHTLHAWEQGKNCLNEANAQKLFEAFSKEGLSITIEWLLYGENATDGHQHLPEPEGEQLALRDILDLRGDLKIFAEIEYFRHNVVNAMSTMVADDALLPFFEAGDYVGGVQRLTKKLQDLVGEFCIIVNDNGQVFTRKILKHQEKNIFLVGGINPQAKLDTPDYFDCAIASAAQITRHWCLGKMLKY